MIRGPTTPTRWSTASRRRIVASASADRTTSAFIISRSPSPTSVAPRLQPAPKPRFSGGRSITTSSKIGESVSGRPSGAPWSTITIASGGSVWARRDATAAAVSAGVL